MKNKKQCPVCMSSGITFYAGGMTGNYECKKCGYLGPIVLELSKNKRTKKKK